MPTIDVSLGGIDLESRESGWQAHVRNAATFAASETDDLARLSRKLTEGVLSEYSDDLPWITRSHNFRLILCLRFGVLLSVDEHDALAASLAAQLRMAKLWSQLCLIPTSLETARAEHCCHTISVSLEHGRDPVGQAARQLHQLNDDVPFQDFRPPLGMPIIKMDSVHLDMQFGRRGRQKRRKLDPNEPHSRTQISSSHGPCFSEDGIVSDFAAFSSCSVNQSIDSLECNEEEATPGFTNWLLDEEHIASELNDAPMLLQPEHEDDPIYGDSRCTVPSLLKRISSPSDLELDLSTSHRQDVLALVDAAIRISITGTPRRLPKKMRITSNESLQHLAPLAPSLWSPEYLLSIASRTVFIPTISHALNTVCANSDSSKNQRPQIETSSKRSDRTSVMSDIKSAVASETPVIILSRLMWRLLSRGMYDHSAARNLAPLSFGIEDITVDSSLKYEMLDADQSWSQSVMAYNENGVVQHHLDYEDGLFTEEGWCSGDEMLEDDLVSDCDSLELLDLPKEDGVDNEAKVQHGFAECLDFWEDLELLDL